MTMRPPHSEALWVGYIGHSGATKMSIRGETRHPRHTHVTPTTVLIVLANSSSTRRHCTVTTQSVCCYNGTSTQPSERQATV
jgi:hypothetical protein